MKKIKKDWWQAWISPEESRPKRCAECRYAEDWEGFFPHCPFVECVWVAREKNKKKGSINEEV